MKCSAYLENNVDQRGNLFLDDMMASEDKKVVVVSVLTSPDLGVTNTDFQAKLFDKAFDVLKRMSSKVVNKFKACYRKNFKICKFPFPFVKVRAC